MGFNGEIFRVLSGCKCRNNVVFDVFTYVLIWILKQLLIKVSGVRISDGSQVLAP